MKKLKQFTLEDITKSVRVSLKNMKRVFSKWQYVLFAVIVGFLFYTLNVYILNFRSVSSSFAHVGFLHTVGYVGLLITGFYHTVKVHSFIALIVICVLFGIFFSLILYKTCMLRSLGSSKHGVLSSVGIFLGILAPGCAACGVGLFSLFGISAATISLLPYDGFEFSIIAILLLGYSIVAFSRTLVSCKI